MVNDNYSYSIIEGKPNPDIFKVISALYDETFDDADLNFFKLRMEEKTDHITILSHHKNVLIGFKIGYRYDDLTFYSWIGGVKLNYRRKGIAKKLASLQEKTLKQNGYKKLRTKSMNHFKPMMILNLKNDFNIIQVYTNSIGQTKIVFEKEL